MSQTAYIIKPKGKPKTTGKPYSFGFVGAKGIYCGRLDLEYWRAIKSSIK